MRKQWLAPLTAAATLASLGLGARAALAEPTFVNGILIPGSALDRTGEPEANEGRLGFFSDIYYEPNHEEWWALSDRGPGGGVIDYSTRLQKFSIKIDEKTGAISKFKIKRTVLLTDPRNLLGAPTSPVGNPRALNGLNPRLLNGNPSTLGRSFDPEGLVIDPRTGHFLISDEYGPSVYEFDRKGELLRIFETPANLIPKTTSGVDYVAERGTTPGLIDGRQDNRGFEGIAITPSGKRLVAVLQDPLIDEPGPNNGRDGRNVRIVVFDNDDDSPTYEKSIAQYVYPLEAQADVLARIVAAGGTGSPTDPRQGRNIGLSAIAALNEHQFLVLERDNRGIGVEDPNGLTVTGSKRVFKIDLRGATDVSGTTLGATLGTIVPGQKSDLFIDLAADTLLPNGKRAEKWEGLAIGPRLRGGARLILAGNDNDYSVTQNTATLQQFDVYVDFFGQSLQRDLDQPTKLNGATVPAPGPTFSLLPGVLHAYRASAADLREYDEPRRFKFPFDLEDLFDFLHRGDGDDD
jgi:hypothetical protein